MSNKSNNQGRAYEFAWIEILNQALNEFGATKIIKNSSCFIGSQIARKLMRAGQRQELLA